VNWLDGSQNRIAYFGNLADARPGSARSELLLEKANAKIDGVS
jgi:hypothetical protein